MALDPKDWGTLAAFSRSTHALLHWVSIVVVRQDAQLSLGRPPDFDDSRVVSWGHLTLEDARHLVERGPNSEPVDQLDLEQTFVHAGEPLIVTFYYHDPARGY